MMTTTITMRITIRCFLIPVCDDTAADALPGRRRLQGFDDLPHGKPPLRCSVSRCKVVITIIIIITTIKITIMIILSNITISHKVSMFMIIIVIMIIVIISIVMIITMIIMINFFEISQSYFNAFSAVSYDEQNARVSVVYNDHSLYIWDVRDIRKVGVFGFPSYYVKN